MRKITFILAMFVLFSCNSKPDNMTKIIFLHHSTGGVIWLGGTNPYVNRITKKSDVKTFVKDYNKKHKTKYYITDRHFPAHSPYGWKNNPYDYYNIWIKNAGDQPYMNEPTLEMLTTEYDVIIFKHCYPVSKILEDTGNPDVNSSERRLENYKLQYMALKDKMHQFPDNKFIVWTPAVHVKNNLSPEEAQRTQDFYTWLLDEWDSKDDNIYLWDFYKYETEGGLYLLDKYATSATDSHPNKTFSIRIAPLFAQFILDVVEGHIK